MRIGLDLDGVVYDWIGTARYLLNSRFGYGLGECRYWNDYPDHVSKEHWDWMWDKGVEQGLFRHGHLIKGAKDGVEKLARLGEVVVMTKRPYRASPDTLAWLAFHELPVSEVHILQGGEKSAILPPCDLYVDDSPDNVKELFSNVRGAFVLLFDQPWNRHMTHWWRATGWPEVVDAARDVKRELKKASA